MPGYVIGHVTSVKNMKAKLLEAVLQLSYRLPEKVNKDTNQIYSKGEKNGSNSNR
jgi:hypothetical protein